MEYPYSSVPSFDLQRADRRTTMGSDEHLGFGIGRGRRTRFPWSTTMNAQRPWLGLAVGLLVVVALASALIAPRAEAQKARADQRYEYKVVCFQYNPGERLTDDARARNFERSLNDYAREGWEPVIDMLNRSNVQTVGGGVTTRNTITFIAFRRPR
jgi:hypothetical protein